ncbi:MAG: helix-turn-helix domain-containing protein, partial [Thermocrinis sp.]|uniref:helix-turn-helix domain-containing protein n=1 Tax=Thermocrinis sp. TaxID=2024383 RepID=UPI003C009F1F
MIVELEIRELVVPQGLLPRVLTGTVEEKVEEYKEMLEQGVEFDPIVVWKRPDGQYWIVDGVHRTEAHKRAGRTTIKAKIVELKDELEYRIEAIKANLKHGLPLRKEEKVILAQTLYKLGVPVAELKKLFGVAERTIYYWLESIKHQEKLELKKKALELKEQGMSLREIADRLGVPKSTVEDWVNESVRFLQKLQFSDSVNNHPLLTPDGTPTEEGFKVLSEFIEENEQALKEKTFNEVVKDENLRAILKYLNEAVKKDFKKLIDADNYEKVKNYLMGMPPYKTLSIRARKVFFEKAKVLWDELKEQREKEKRLEGYVLEKAKEILSDIDYQFSTWKSLRFELSRRGVEISGYEELVDEILHKHADELLEVYRRIPEATEDSISMEELIKIKEEVQGEKDRWAREYKAREAIRRVLREKGLRIINSVVERAVKKIEELIRQEEWEKLEQIAKEIKETTPEEIWEDLRESYEKKFGKKAQEQRKTKEK